jgi:hypothetical protein
MASGSWRKKYFLSPIGGREHTDAEDSRGMIVFHKKRFNKLSIPNFFVSLHPQ